MKPKILFLCTGNSCRSQMAEGWAKKLLRNQVDSYSAGTAPHGLNPVAIEVMKEAGVDISTHSSKSLESLRSLPFELVITVCDNAAAACPAPPAGTRVIHVPFDDPPALAKNAKNSEEAKMHYRRVRDEIKAFVQSLPNLFGES